ncbi:MAG TPA: hypothetical protein PKV72_00745 [Candidatus Peribacteria bacterium]|nr:hypothetical protein [Candidatus Peribacteria bacterium]
MPPNAPSFSPDLPEAKRKILQQNAEWHLDSRNRYPDAELVARWEELARGSGIDGDPLELDRAIMQTMGYVSGRMRGLDMGYFTNPKDTRDLKNSDARRKKSTKAHS